MWPYNDAEADWLELRKEPARPTPKPVNDNDPARRVPLRALPAPPGKSEHET